MKILTYPNFINIKLYSCQCPSTINHRAGTIGVHCQNFGFELEKSFMYGVPYWLKHTPHFSSIAQIASPNYSLFYEDNK